MKVALTTLSVCVAGLLALGLVMLYSSSMVMMVKNTNIEVGAKMLRMQTVWCVMGIIACAVIAALGTFLPCYLFVVGLAPSFRKYAKNVRIKGFVDGVTAAASGAIAGAAFILGRRAIVDIPTAVIAIAALAAMTWLKKAPEPILIVVAGIVGLLLSPR